jgi:peptidoglycan/LPS O-acetylase OafA/YrhL
VLATTVFLLLIAVIALGWTSRIRWRGLTVAGTLTFPLYLLRDVIGMTAAHHFGDRVDPWLLLGVAVAGLILLSYVVQRFVERPIAVAVRRLLSSAAFSLEPPKKRR